MTLQFIGPLGLINQTLHQEEGCQDSHSWEENFQQDHQEAVEDSQGAEARLEEDLLMRDQGEEETLKEGQTSWWEIHLKYSREYEQKLSTSSLNGSFMSALTSPTRPSRTTIRGACFSSPTSKEQECRNGYLP